MPLLKKDALDLIAQEAADVGSWQYGLARSKTLAV